MCSPATMRIIRVEFDQFKQFNGGIVMRSSYYDSWYCPTFIGRIRGKPYFYPVRIRTQNQGLVPEGKGGGAIDGVVCSFVRAPKKERVTIKPLKSLAVIYYPESDHAEEEQS